MSAHAKLGASSAHRWMACPGSVRISEDLPDTSSPAAEEGTKAHELAEAILTKGINPSDHPQEMVDYVMSYVAYIEEYSKPDSKVLIEQRVDYSDWVNDGFGTADAIIIDGSHMHVIDLKYGKGVKVDALNNPQPRLYALGALSEYQFTYGIDTVTTHIVQPRLDHISTETIDVTCLLDWADSVLVPAAIVAASDTGPFAPGEKQCQFCKARYICKARAIDILTALPSPKIPDDVMVQFYELAKDAEQWAKDVQSTVLNLATDGKPVPGYKLVEGRSVRKLTDNAAEVLSNHDIYLYKEVPKTITDLTKELGGKKKADPILDSCTSKPAGKPTLAPMSDKRQAITTTAENFPTGE